MDRDALDRFTSMLDLITRYLDGSGFKVAHYSTNEGTLRVVIAFEAKPALKIEINLPLTGKPGFYATEDRDSIEDLTAANFWQQVARELAIVAQWGNE